MRLGAAAAAIASAALSGCVGPAPAPPAAVVPAPAPPPILPPVHGRVELEGQAIQGNLLHGIAPDGAVTLTVGDQPVAIAPDRRFVIGLDRDAPPSITLAMTDAAGGRWFQPLAIAPRAWRIERVDAPYKAGKSDAEFDRLRPAELARIAAARAMPVDSDGWRQAFRWPAAGRQSGWFGAQRVYQGKPGSYHSGADIAVPTGTPVRAPADGIVILAADHPFTLEGNLLMVGHGLGLTSAFLHLSRILVPAGATVRQGDVIALSGATGRATGPHLHWGLSWNSARLDPLLVAGPLPAR